MHKTRILPRVGNMILLPNPGKPGFYGVGLPGRVILCQPSPSDTFLRHNCEKHDDKVSPRVECSPFIQQRVVKTDVLG